MIVAQRLSFRRFYFVPLLRDTLRRGTLFFLISTPQGRRCFLHLSHSWNETCLGIKSRMHLVLSLLGRWTALDSPDQLRPCSAASHRALSHFCVSWFLISWSSSFSLSYLESQPPCQPHFLYLPLNKCWDSQGFSSRLSPHLLTLITNTC